MSPTRLYRLLAAVIYYFHQVIVKDNKTAWLGIGIALGLGIISKYTIALWAVQLCCFCWLIGHLENGLRDHNLYCVACSMHVIFTRHHLEHATRMGIICFSKWRPRASGIISRYHALSVTYSFSSRRLAYVFYCCSQVQNIIWQDCKPISVWLPAYLAVILYWPG